MGIINSYKNISYGNIFFEFKLISDHCTDSYMLLLELHYGNLEHIDERNYKTQSQFYYFKLKI